MKGVHCQTSAITIAMKDQVLSDSQGMPSNPKFLSVRLKMPTVG